MVRKAPCSRFRLSKSSSKASFWNTGVVSLIEVGDKRYAERKLDTVQSSGAAVNQVQKVFGKSLGGDGGATR